MFSCQEFVKCAEKAKFPEMLLATPIDTQKEFGMQISKKYGQSLTVPQRELMYVRGVYVQIKLKEHYNFKAY